MFLIVFSTALLIANIYCFINKKYLYLFIPCMLFLPEYYGIEINERLPLITITRIMFVVFYFYAILNKRRNIAHSGISIKTLPKAYFFLAGYFFFRILSNLYYVTTYGQAAKTIFAIIFEQLFLLIAIYMLNPSKEELRTTITIVVWTATILFTIGILESLTSIRPFDALYTVSRHLMNSHYIRLGLLRATATMGMPNTFSNACLLMLPLTLYLYNISCQKKYLLCIFINFIAGVHSGSRAYFFSFIFTLAFYFAFVLRTAPERIRFSKNAAIICALILLFMVSSSLINPNLQYFYIGTSKSLLNEVGFDFDLSEGAPDGVKGYGGNSGSDYSFTGGVGSRRAQLSGIEYTLARKPLFGFGSGALLRQEVQYNFGGYWKPVHAIDVGIVEILVYEGIVGLIGYISIFIFLLFNKKATLKNIQSRFYYLAIFCYLLSTLSTANMVSFLFFYALYKITGHSPHLQDTGRKQSS